MILLNKPWGAFQIGPRLVPGIENVVWGLFIGLGHNPKWTRGLQQRFLIQLDVTCSRPVPIYQQEDWDQDLGQIGHALFAPRLGIRSSAWTGRTQWIKAWRWHHRIEIRRAP